MEGTFIKHFFVDSLFLVFLPKILVLLTKYVYGNIINLRLTYILKYCIILNTSVVTFCRVYYFAVRFLIV